eukprot:1106539-Rhodomonas_salina.1
MHITRVLLLVLVLVAVLRVSPACHGRVMVTFSPWYRAYMRLTIFATLGPSTSENKKVPIFITVESTFCQPFPQASIAEEFS